MEINIILDLLMFLSVIIFLMAGFPVAFTLGGIAIIFVGIGLYFGEIDSDFIGLIPERIYGTMTNDVLLAVPLFIFMGVMLERSKIAEDLLDSMAKLMGRLPGGLGISVTIVGALLAASTGIVGATVVTMGLLSLPTMLKRGYNPALACGSIASSGTLGQIIPPSIVLVLLGDQLSSAWQTAQLNLGNWAPEPLSVGDLFAGALIPGICLVFLYIIYQIIIAIFMPKMSPSYIAEDEDVSIPTKQLIMIFLPPIFLIIAVLGSIISGIATPTEAAAVGAIGAILMAGYKLSPEKPTMIFAAGYSMAGLIVLTNIFDLRLGRDEIAITDYIGIFLAVILTLCVLWGIGVAVYRTYIEKTLHIVMQSTTRISAMIFMILIGAAMFSLVFKGFEGDIFIHEFLSDLPGGKLSALILVMLVMFVLGFFLDFIEIVFVVVPIVAPVLLMMDINPIWLGIMMAMNLQTSFLTPPFGFALFYLRGVAPESVSTMQIYKGVLPFVLIQIFMLCILWEFPELTTWLPSVLFK
ncbi:MAG: TRAP transporter large permease subunit [Emcibacter sp.]|nr:TRAP transporter large permease subunit [Emcibacter sp.]